VKLASILAPSLLLCALGSTFAGCFIDNPDAVAPGTQPGAEAGVDASPGEDAGDPDASGPTLCTKYGGYPTVEVIIGQLFQSLLADCRISKFFSGLTPDRQQHLYDCLVDQVSVVLGCPGIRYDVDNAGVECRDMRASHKGLAIRGEDFDALIEDLVGVLQGLNVEPDDIAAVAPSLLALRDDIVTNSAPGLAKPVCSGEANP